MKDIFMGSLVIAEASWQQILRNNFTRWNTLADFLELDEEQRRQLVQNPQFPLNVPLRLAKKMAKKTLDDPLLRQFLATVEEQQPSTRGFCSDPVGDQHFRRASKLLHKYKGRALLVCTSACAMHCRYCFRQNFDYDVSNKLFEEELKILSEDSTIHEIILSGGDPLSLPDRRLQELLNALSAIPHIKRLRFHTRFPIGIPERIDEGFLEILPVDRFAIWFVIHANHPRELDALLFQRLKKLQLKGVVVLNQAVLLKDVNDDIDTLKELCETLANHSVLPYYLHQLDCVEGAEHFEVEEKKGLELMQQLEAQLSGYAVPKYVKEIPWKMSKTLIRSL
jgi:EF-P beta-lysylation protein EpmB